MKQRRYYYRVMWEEKGEKYNKTMRSKTDAVLLVKTLTPLPIWITQIIIDTVNGEQVRTETPYEINDLLIDKRFKR